MKKVVEHLKSRLRAVAGPNGGVQSETPLAFLHRMTNGTSLEAKPLKFCFSRLSSLLRTLQVSNLVEFNALTDVADFATLLSTYAEGVAKFAIIMEPNGSSIPGAVDPVIQLACLDASLAIAPLFKRFGSVIITSGTLSPMDLYPKLLDFQPCVSECLNMSTFRPCLRPLVITRGSDQLAVSTKFDDRGDMGVVRNYGKGQRWHSCTGYFYIPTFLSHCVTQSFSGAILVELCSAIPDGVVAFFTSYSYMESLISEWDAMGILREVTKSKLVFIETKDVVETTLALDNYRRACDCGRGAVFLSVARGKVGINGCASTCFALGFESYTPGASTFSCRLAKVSTLIGIMGGKTISFIDYYSLPVFLKTVLSFMFLNSAVIMFGIPFQYTLSHVLRARLEYLQTHHQIREQDFLNFDALRQASQCVGRVIRSKTDYGLMIFADSRYNRHDKRSKLPKWILQFLPDAYLNLSTDMALQHVKQFLRLMGQPIDQVALQSVLLTLDEVNRMNPPPMQSTTSAGQGGAMIVESTNSQ
jgi:DNA excision repair protein ERCC-2